MAVQLTRLEALRKSDNPDDTLNAASVSGIEGSAVDHQDFLTGVLSQIKRIIHGSAAGNWHDDIEGSADSLVDLYNRATLEGKNILVNRLITGDTSVPANVKATGTLTGTANFGNNETVTIDTKVYTFQTTLTNVDGNVLIGADLQESLGNLKAAINLEAGSGTKYAAATTLHPTVTCTASDATTLSAEAKNGGTAGNSIATTETAANASWAGPARSAARRSWTEYGRSGLSVWRST